jgi:cytochrome b subunit of formate dehydrogenase
MNTKEPRVCGVTEDRFRTILMFLRMAGVPINMKHASMLHSTYNVLMTINAYALCLAFYMDIIIHNDDLKNFMKTFRIVNSSLVLHWLHLNSG